MTNRPDKLDIDIKRAGRLDRKIPFLYPQSGEEVINILKAQLKKNKVKAEIDFAQENPLAESIVGYSNADIEAIVMLANDYSGDAPVRREDLERAVKDYLPSRDVQMLEYMELLAVFEASNRRMLPKKYSDVPVDELQQRLQLLKAQVGSRR
jgi:ATP-dependent 26S proteasome regulatory subunit